jgi:cobalt-zinc-cadmium efflux system protein
MPADLHHHDPDDAIQSHARVKTNVRSLGVAVVITLGFAAVEFFAALASGSIALMADAGHMVADSTALFVALMAQLIARRPPSAKRTYGDGRIEALAAFVNSLALVGLAIWIAIEAIERFTNTREIAGQMVMIVAGIGLLVNVVIAWVLSKDQDSLNTKAALVHVLGDLLGSVAALISGAVIYFTGWTPIDPILSLFVCALILKSTFSLLKKSYGVLMEHVPADVDFHAVAQDLLTVRGVRHVHNLHIWETSPGHVTLTVHLELDHLSHWPEDLPRLQALLRDKHGIDHATLQPEVR